MRLQRRGSNNLEPADFVIAAEVLAPLLFDVVAWKMDWKTVSVRWGEFLEDPKTRILFVAFWTTVTAHLFWRLPLPFQKTAKKIVLRTLK